MSRFLVTGKCADCGDEHEIRLEEGFDRVYAETFAGLLDGSFPPGAPPLPAESSIGRCGKCGGRYKCEVTEVPET